jgi:hypothetical protein
MGRDRPSFPLPSLPPPCRRLFGPAALPALSTLLTLAGAAVIGAGVLIAGTSVPACAGFTRVGDPSYPSGRQCPATTIEVTPQAYAKFADPAVGLRFARDLFAGITLPPGARPVAAPPELRIPPGWGLAPSSDVGRVWQVPLPAVDVAWFFARHPPRGTAMASSGSGGATARPAVVSALYYQATSVPAALTGGQVVVVVDPAGTGRTFIRIDAQAVL